MKNKIVNGELCRVILHPKNFDVEAKKQWITSVRKQKNYKVNPVVENDIKTEGAIDITPSMAHFSGIEIPSKKHSRGEWCHFSLPGK